MDNPNYLEINKASWNKKTDIHILSDFYDNENFLKGKSSLKSIELDLLGDITGKTILHLQCHFGQDTISLSRMGAIATGIDLSDNAINKAKEFAKQTNSEARFICCNIYDLPEHLEEQFDIVFTSYGTIGWLPDMEKWASIVSKYLKPGGQFVIAEFHPVVWMYDDDLKKIAYKYFNDGPIIESYTGTYADKTADIKQDYVMWNHSLSDVVNNLIKHGLVINSLDEFDYSPYDCLNGMEEIAPGKFIVKHIGPLMPLVYSISATK